MGVARDLFLFVREFLSFVRDPDGYGERKRRELEQYQAERRHQLEERYGDLDALFRDVSQRAHFSTFAAAIDTISYFLEEDDPAGLAALIPGFST